MILNEAKEFLLRIRQLGNIEKRKFDIYNSYFRIETME